MATIKKHGKIELSKSELNFLKDNFQTMTNSELANHLGLKLTKTRTVLYELGLKRMKLEYWTSDQVDFLLKNYQTIGDKMQLNLTAHLTVWLSGFLLNPITKIIRQEISTEEMNELINHLKTK